MLLEELKDIANHNQCKNGKHNPLVAHLEDKCWALNPHQRLIANQKGASSNNTVATSSNAYEQPAFQYCITAQCFLTDVPSDVVWNDDSYYQDKL
ncbi:hypothetical protein PGTUg99_016055 [Puccinia graminis f. sp. tritici]|uniref:Uncharacterized protein n=1 Tax=Puccinia graminis f. sp. tritici TaxID=56615 RepID=A0A5B0MDN6_PUCGR|nr:hypothetical protein PGTUg99_016055 [Puccinia graminis f. sp. tritici]